MADQYFCKIRVTGVEFEPSPRSSLNIADEYQIAMVVQKLQEGYKDEQQVSQSEFLTNCFL